MLTSFLENAHLSNEEKCNAWMQIRNINAKKWLDLNTRLVQIKADDELKKNVKIIYNCIFKRMFVDL